MLRCEGVMGFARREVLTHVLNHKEMRRVHLPSCLAKACDCQEFSLSSKSTDVGLAGPEAMSEKTNGTKKIQQELSAGPIRDRSGGAACLSSLDREELHEISQKCQKPCEQTVAIEQRDDDVIDRKSGKVSVDFNRTTKLGHQSGCARGGKTSFGLEGIDFDAESSEEKRGSGGSNQQPLNQREINVEMWNSLNPLTAEISDLGPRGANDGKEELQEADVIVIEDDDDTDLENHKAFGNIHERGDDYDSDASSKALPRSHFRRPGKENFLYSSDTASEFSQSSKEEDCCIMEPGPSSRRWHSHEMGARADKTAAPNLFNCRDDQSSLSYSSDCEIIEDPQGTFRQHWEQAAFHKRVRVATKIGSYRAESEGSASNLATSTCVKQSRQGNEDISDPVSQNEGKEQREGICSKKSVASVDSKSPNHRKGSSVVSDQQDSNCACSDILPEREANTDEVLPVEKILNVLGSHAVSPDVQPGNMHLLNLAAVEAFSGGQALNESLADALDPGVFRNAGGNANDELLGSKGGETATEATPQENLIGDRERLKQTAEFRSADEEEWARRQLELQRQAEETRRLRKRKKAEANRKIEMESRQRLRLEEIRQSQQKEEQNLDIKQQVRGRIQAELEHMATTCMDMATLLRRLGVQVDGGTFPTTQQVNAAYKRALLRFHPDRIAGLAKSDPARQVEAEETFKLISRLKNTMQPVANRYFS